MTNESRVRQISPVDGYLFYPERIGRSALKLSAAAMLAGTLVLAGCGGGSDTQTVDMSGDAELPDVSAERSAITTAIDAAENAVGMVDNDADDATVAAAEAAIISARNAITAAANLPAEERAANARTVDALAEALDASKAARRLAMDDAADAERMAMMATAMKLRAGISAPTDDTSADTRRHATYATDDIAVSIGTADAVNLSEDEDVVVAALHGWEGMRFAAEPDGEAGAYEAVVYSNVGEPTPGKKFGTTGQDDDYEYELTDGTLDEFTTEGTASRVASSSFDQSAGVKLFELPDNTVAVLIPGSYHGVSGTYRCEPDSNSTCAVRVASDGFNLGGVDNFNAFSDLNAFWSFKPTDPETRLMDVPDDVYASYGWWLHKSEDDATYTASAFTAYKGGDGNAENASGVTALHGTATYSGGAAGKYALHSATGGTNDAGQFTAEATLEADFSDDMISGTIDNFTGADGQPRAWSVELMESGVGDTGTILGADGTGDPMKTVWTIDGTAAAESGQWRGNLYETGDDGVPAVATGTFYSEYGADGKVVGAFGVNN